MREADVFSPDGMLLEVAEGSMFNLWQLMMPKMDLYTVEHRGVSGQSRTALKLMLRFLGDRYAHGGHNASGCEHPEDVGTV
jgi:hypothetical protein